MLKTDAEELLCPFAIGSGEKCATTACMAWKDTSKGKISDEWKEWEAKSIKVTRSIDARVGMDIHNPYGDVDWDKHKELYNEWKLDNPEPTKDEYDEITGYCTRLGK